MSPSLASRAASLSLTVALLAWGPDVVEAKDAAASRYGFGEPATPQQIAAWDIDVRPDGTGLPAGRGTVAQGQALYDAQCASCHGTFGESTDYMALAGGVGTLGSDQPIRTTGSKLNHATTLWDYINRAMPFAAPKTLTPDEVYALTAYVLHLNDLLPANASLDRDSIVKLKLPNRDGFTTRHGLGSVRGTPDTHNVACMRDCMRNVQVSSQMPEHARNDHGDLAAQMRTVGTRGRSLANVASAPGGASPPGEGVRATASHADLAKNAGCTACHGATQRIVGPAFREIGARYASEPGAKERLARQLRQGSSGVWGAVPMPPQTQLSETDARALAGWILDGAR